MISPPFRRALPFSDQPNQVNLCSSSVGPPFTSLRVRLFQGFPVSVAVAFAPPSSMPQAARSRRSLPAAPNQLSGVGRDGLRLQIAIGWSASGFQGPIVATPRADGRCHSRHVGQAIKDCFARALRRQRERQASGSPSPCPTRPEWRRFSARPDSAIIPTSCSRSPRTRTNCA